MTKKLTPQRERIESLVFRIIGSVAKTTFNQFEKGGERAWENAFGYAEEAILEEREAAILEAIDVFKRHYVYNECLCTRPPVMHMPWNELLPPQEQVLPKDEGASKL